MHLCPTEIALGVVGVGILVKWWAALRLWRGR